MKAIINSILLIFSVIMISGCSGRSSRSSESIAKADTVTVPDTGFTGIKQYFSNNMMVKEVTFKNSIRHGETKSYYLGGQLYQRFWYENGSREDSAVWYYPEGQVFRTTPYVHDTINGIQKQYYRTGSLKAKICYRKGLRTPVIEEFTSDGRRVTGYPEIVYKIDDSYQSSGRVKINLELSRKEFANVKFYRGEFASEVFDTTKCIKLTTRNGKALIDLKKTAGQQSDYVGVIAVILTNFGNNYLAFIKIDLPYRDLK
ncbi:MAG: hypothetical protein WCE64_01095 [Bacteroidales bacterium]